MLRGMGFDNNTSVYVAAGKIYKAEKYMAPLKQMFPRLETKESLAFPEELAPFQVLVAPLYIFILFSKDDATHRALFLSMCIMNTICS